MAMMRRIVLLVLSAALLSLGPPAGAGAVSVGLTTEFQLPPGTRATGLVGGPDGNLWFAGYSSASVSPAGEVVGRITPAGAVSVHPLPPTWPAQGGEIAIGADGNAWFTAPSRNAVGRLTPAGEVTLFPLPTAAAVPTAIAAGPGGAIWFVEEGVDAIGRVDPAGSITEFRLPAGSRPSGIAQGPDGAIWIAAKGRSRIVRMLAGGAVAAEYPLPEAGLPHAIVSGPGGELWFSDEAAPRVGRISAAGVIDEFRVPSKYGTRELVLGGDGDLWFTTGYAIGSIAANGETGEPACVDRTCQRPVAALAKGPDGEVWFGGSVIGIFSEPPLAVRLGHSATRVAAGLTTIGFSCHGGAAGDACRGEIRLTASVPRIGGGGIRKVVLDRHRYRLQPATGRRLPLQLGSRGIKALARSKRLVVRVSATLVNGTSSGKRFVLRPRRGR